MRRTSEYPEPAGNILHRPTWAKIAGHLRLPIRVLIFLSLVLSCGCTTVQRDYYQAPPAEPSDSIALSARMSETPALVKVADLDWQYVSDQVVAWEGFTRYEIRQGGESEGSLIFVHLPSDAADQVHAEVRHDTGWGRTLSDHAYLESLRQAAQSDLESKDTEPAQGIGTIDQPTIAPIKGRWIDLEQAVSKAGSSERIVELAVLDADRWRYATIFNLRTMLGQPGMLIVLGDRLSDAGPEQALVRLGRFGSHGDERAFLQRLQGELDQLGREPRLPGAR